MSSICCAFQFLFSYWFNTFVSVCSISFLWDSEYWQWYLHVGIPFYLLLQNNFFNIISYCLFISYLWYLIRHILMSFVSFFYVSWVQTERPRSLFSLSESGQGPPLGSCRPQKHIMFLKTHKTASSTVLNMLYRFGEEQGLRFALPMGYQFGYPLPFIAQRVKGYRGPHVVEFDVMGNHMRFYKPEVWK